MPVIPTARARRRSPAARLLGRLRLGLLVAAMRGAEVAHARPGLVALLVLACLAHLLAARRALFQVRLALRRVGGVAAEALFHAVAPLVARLAFAGLARLVARLAHLRDARLAGLRVLGLRAVELARRPALALVGVRRLGVQ